MRFSCSRGNLEARPQKTGSLHSALGRQVVKLSLIATPGPPLEYVHSTYYVLTYLRKFYSSKQAKSLSVGSIHRYPSGGPRVLGGVSTGKFISE